MHHSQGRLPHLLRINYHQIRRLPPRIKHIKNQIPLILPPSLPSSPPGDKNRLPCKAPRRNTPTMRLHPPSLPQVQLRHRVNKPLVAHQGIDIGIPPLLPHLQRINRRELVPKRRSSQRQGTRFYQLTPPRPVLLPVLFLTTTTALCIRIPPFPPIPKPQHIPPRLTLQPL